MLPPIHRANGETMSRKREARIAYYNGLKTSMARHIRATEKGIRSMEGVSETEMEKLLASVRKKHEKLLKRIDDQFATDLAASAAPR
jgi:hypothetical protein